LCLFNDQTYAGLSDNNNGGVYAYNGGSTWTQIGSSVANIDVFALQSLGSNLYAGTNNDGVLKAVVP
jgi:hypothetical protein